MATQRIDLPGTNGAAAFENMKERTLNERSGRELCSCPRTKGAIEACRARFAEVNPALLFGDEKVMQVCSVTKTDAVKEPLKL
ncbi:hypothetical protein ACFL3T_00050 [Patescibacteria group bacterium]